MSLIDLTLNGYGQDYFKANAYLVGNTDYANYRTDGVNDQVQLQQAVDKVVANLASNLATATTLPTQIRVISNLNVQFTTAFTETLGGDTRRLAVQLKDNVQIIITAGCTISFPSGGNSGLQGGTAFTSVFGNFGNLTGASVVCEGLNAFDGLSGTAGTATDRHSAIWLDARSNSCTILKNCYFKIAVKKTAGRAIRYYNSNSIGTSIADNIKTDLMQAEACYVGFWAERGGTGISLEARHVANSINDGIVYKDGVLNSSISIDLMENIGTNGLKILIDPTITTTFNELTVKASNITTCGNHGIYIQGMNGIVEASSTNNQQSGCYVEQVQNGATFYYPKKLVIRGKYMNNNQSGASTYGGGIMGASRNVQIEDWECSDTQTIPTQKWGINFDFSSNDYIHIGKGKAERNITYQCLVYGVNSRVDKDVIGFIRAINVSASTTRTITGAEDIYLLNAGSTLRLPKFSLLSTDLMPKYQVIQINGVGFVKATQEDDLSFKSIDSIIGSTGVSIPVNRQLEVMKDSGLWRTKSSTPFVQDSSESIITSTILTYSGLKLVNTTAGDQANILPLASTVLGQIFRLKKVSKDFSIATFTCVGSDVIEAYDTHLTVPIATNCKITIPDEYLELIAITGGWRRGAYCKPMEILRSNAYRATTNQSVAGSTTTAVQFNAIYQDKIDTIDINFGHIIAVNFWWVAPMAGDIYMDWNILGLVTAGSTSFSTFCKISRDSGATFPNDVLRGSTVAVTAGTDQVSEGHGVLRVNKGDYLQVNITNLSATAMLVGLNSPNFANRVPPFSSFLNIRYTENNY